MNDVVIVAFIGVAGAVIGSVATVAASIASQYCHAREAAKREKPRRDLLLKMLNNPQYQWRELETLMHVVGADEETTKRLLLEIGARASEDGKPVWSLVSRNPLP